MVKPVETVAGESDGCDQEEGFFPSSGEIEKRLKIHGCEVGFLERGNGMLDREGEVRVLDLAYRERGNPDLSFRGLEWREGERGDKTREWRWVVGQLQEAHEAYCIDERSRVRRQRGSD